MDNLVNIDPDYSFFGAGNNDGRMIWKVRVTTSVSQRSNTIF